MKAPPRTIRRRASCEFVNSFPEEHERIRTTRRARLNRNDRVPLRRKEQRDPESRLCDALTDRTIPSAESPAAGAAPVRLACCEARQRPCAPVEHNNHTMTLRAGSAGGVAPAFDCTGTLWRLKASLRCAPALRGLDPPSAFPQIWQLPERDHHERRSAAWSLRETEYPRSQPGSLWMVPTMESVHDHVMATATVKEPERPRWAPRLTIYEVAALSSYSAYASRTRFRMRSWAAASAIGRSSVKLRFSPLTEY